MSFTRVYDDIYTIKQQVDSSTYTGNYMLNTPGPGRDIPFLQDPVIRLQKWGANLHTNAINVESDLLGITRPLNRDNIHLNDYTKHSVNSTPLSYSEVPSFIEDTRMTHPSWLFKDLQQSRVTQPLYELHNDIEPQFNQNIQTRILEKDHYTPRIPIVMQK